MAKDDKELGKWVSTAIVNKTSIKQFKKGFIIKKSGESITERIKCDEETTSKDMSNFMSQKI